MYARTIWVAYIGGVLMVEMSEWGDLENGCKCLDKNQVVSMHT